MKVDVLEQLLRDRAAKRSVVLATRIATGEQRLLYPHEAPPAGELEAAALAASRRDKSEPFERAGEMYFLQVYNPPARAILVGAVHIAQALAPMARLAGFEVVVVDPRQAFASEARFGDIPLDTRWPDEALAALSPDPRTAVITLTHDPKIDEPALLAALESPAFYIGALGSRRTHAARLERLRARGVGDEALSRIHAPVGLRIGAVLPPEIAVSILGELVAAMRQGPDE